MEKEKQTDWHSGKRESSSENKFTMIWEIENPKYFRHMLNELYSPLMMVDVMERTGWRLVLYRLLPSTRIYATLKREGKDLGPVQFDLVYHFDITPVGEAELENKPLSNAFRRDESGPGILLCTDDGTRSCNCFLSRKITITCVMKNKYGAILRSGQCVSRTRLGREDFKFVGRVENFSALKPGGRRSLKTLSTSVGQMIIDLTLDEENGDEIEVVITPAVEKSDYMYMFKSSLLDYADNNTNIRTYNIRTQQKVQKLQVGARKSHLRRNASQFLPKDTLRLFCEITIKTGVEFEKVEEIEYETYGTDDINRKVQSLLKNRSANSEKAVPGRGSSSFSSNHDSKSKGPFPNRFRAGKWNDNITDVNQQVRSSNRRANFEKSTPTQEASHFPFGHDSKFRNPPTNNFRVASKHDHDVTFSLKSALDDFTAFYKKGILCDTKLQTATKTFPAHKAILSARSPVFEAMFTSNMREKTEECIRIDDVDAETMKRFLSFLYSATLERLEWQDAKKLYFAADKYQVLSLKYRCVGILRNSIDSSNCCELLLLADMHQDENLKAAVQRYITRYNKEVLTTDQWRYMEKWHSALAFDTLHAIHMKNS